MTSNNNHPMMKDRSLSTKYESLDYDLIENVIHLEHEHNFKRNNFITRDLQRWLAIFIIGLATALSGFAASFSVNFMTHMKFGHIIQAAEAKCPREDTPQSRTTMELLECMWLPYVYWVLWNILPTLFGSLLVTYLAPIAAGSGIPVVKCYLNGIRIPDVVSFNTYVAKLLGVISSVVGGLAVGKEGPFIHCGAALGAGLSQGEFFGFKTRIFSSFRNDRDKRDFVSAGASAGVAAAFGAPIGGVLFALEEGASFWNQALTWRIFFCSMMTSFILNLLMSAYNHNAGVLAFYSLVNFGLVEELDYFWFEIPVYICIAILGGIIGAFFCFMNMILTKWRKRYVNGRATKVIEAVLLALVTATAGAILLIWAPECRELPKAIQSNIIDDTPATETSNGLQFFKNLLHHSSSAWTPRMSRQNHTITYDPDQEIKKALSGHVLSFMCPRGQYSAMSSLWLKTSEGSSSTFMVLQDDIWSIPTLALFMIVYYILSIMTYGMSISSGVFIPSLLVGATGGRLIGLMLRNYFGPLEWLAQLNKFSIIGAASTLGGVVRMTISLTVIIIEATGCISFGLPIMICLMVSKWVADSFIEGLYDLAIHMADIPFLDWEPPKESHTIYASDAMAPGVKALRTTETVANIVSILESTTHNGFPVVDIDEHQPENQYHSYGGPSKSGNSHRTTGDFYTPDESPNQSSRMTPKVSRSTSDSDTRTLIDGGSSTRYDDSLIGSFQRCEITPKRESYGRFRGLVLRWQLIVMLELRIFNENERSFEMLNLPAFQSSYPKYPSLERVVRKLTPEMYNYHVDLRSIMNPTSYSVLYSASLSRIYRLFRSLGLRHLIVTDDRNHVVGMITRKDLARYVRERDEKGLFRFYELDYSN